MRILAFAYACEPGKGSEPGAGWGLVQLLASFSSVSVVTRANNRPAIEAALPGVANAERIDFHYVDLPERARRWKRGSRGVRLYYMLWQVAALRVARRLQREEPFDLVWHLTLANAWLGSLAHRVGPPFVYGPVGGGVPTPWGLWRALGLRGVLFDALRGVSRSVGRTLNPAARASWRRASLILVQNPETMRWFPAAYRDRCRVFQHAQVEGPLLALTPRRPAGVACFAGRLIPWKGLALAVEAVGLTRDWRLVICGDGPEAPRLRTLIERRGLQDRVELRGAVSQEQLFHTLSEEAGVLLFPSMHDDSPLAVAEAVTAGIPVVCLDRGGPPLLAGDAGVVVSSKGGAARVAARLRDALEEAASMPALSDDLRAVHTLRSRRATLLTILRGAGLGGED